MERVILHCDLNNYFASVSLLFHPELRNFPVAVCGDSATRHGIVLAKNELAKKFGIKTAEPIWQAKEKCPELHLILPFFRAYNRYSEAVKNIYRRYTDRIEPFGIDECWLDVTGSTMLFGSGEEIAERIRNEVRSELNLTVSVGVSFNKIFAKLGSDLKKPDATTVISRENFKEKIWGLDVASLLFVGPHTESRLKGNGIFTIGDLTVCSGDTLKRLLGKNGEQLRQYALGCDSSPVAHDNSFSLPKSIGRSETTAHDFASDEDVWTAFLRFADEISVALRRYGMFAEGVQISLRSQKLVTSEYSARIDPPTNVGLFLARAGMELYRANKSDIYRSVGIRAISLKQDFTAVQTDIFVDDCLRQKQEVLEAEMDLLRARFGKTAVLRGALLKNERAVNRTYR